MRATRRRRTAMERRLARRAARAEDVESTRAVFAAREAGEGWVDILHHTPLLTADPELLRSAMRFGFESGDAGGLLSAASGSGAPSRFHRESELAGLFVPNLVDGLMTIPTEDGILMPDRTALMRVLTRPTDDPRDRELRHAVLHELSEKDDLQKHLVDTLMALRELRGLLDDRPMTTGETVRRKIELLNAVRRFFESASVFHSADSALARLGAFAVGVREREAWTKLVDFLRQEGQAAELQVRLVLDYAGKIRDYEVLAHRREEGNPLVRSPWRQLWEKIVGFFRGHRFGEHEVILRIIDDLFEGFEDALLPCFSLITHLEFYAAALSFKGRIEQAGLQACLPTFADENARVELHGLFNPLLLLVDGVTPVPCDVRFEADAMVLVTGPNSGGKTRMLQAVALTQLFAQSGFFVPAREASLVAAPKMFVSLIESAPADHKEGRLGTELLRVRKLFEGLEPGVMVILDELCSGTNPSEGIAIFEMVLSLLPRAKPRALMTTHFLDAARRFQKEEQALQFLQVELAEDESPTYQFVPGVAPTSLAHAVAARLGVTQEELEALVREASPEAP